MRPQERRSLKLLEFPVLHAGWELDNKGWIVELPVSRSRRIVLTSHGREYFAKPNELREKIAEYQAAIDKTQAALELLKSRNRER